MARLVAQDYFREALSVLAEQGSDGADDRGGVRRARVTKGSFYHHFGSLGGFVEQLLPYWEGQRSSRLAGRYPAARRIRGGRLTASIDLDRRPAARHRGRDAGVGLAPARDRGWPSNGSIVVASDISPS